MIHDSHSTVDVSDVSYVHDNMCQGCLLADEALEDGKPCAKPFPRTVTILQTEYDALKRDSEELQSLLYQQQMD